MDDVSIRRDELGPEASKPTVRLDSPEAAAADQESACRECARLKVRVDRLEQLFSEFADGRSVAAASLGTTSCYWILVGLHGLVLASLLTGLAGMLAYPFLCGCLGTLAACHALPMRPILIKWLRTFLSITTVGLCGLLALGLLNSVDVEWLSILLVGLPMYFLPTLVGAQLPVWILGWRIQTPNHKDRTQPRFRILDIMGMTVIFAVYAMLLRVANLGEADMGLSDGGWIYVVASQFVCVLVGIVAAACARGFLANGGGVKRRWLCYAALLSVVAATTFGAVLLVADGQSQLAFDQELLMYFLIYVVGGSVVGLASPVFTFYFMRLAGYRMAYRRAASVAP